MPVPAVSLINDVPDGCSISLPSATATVSLKFGWDITATYKSGANAGEFSIGMVINPALISPA